jgi:imidazolonepropionase-like amidohydrolase
MKTRGTVIDQMVVKAESAMKMALGENPKRVYSGKNLSPTTRMASAGLIRDALIKAREYRAKQIAYKADFSAGKDVTPPETNLKWASLSRVFDGFPVKIHAHQQDDIATAIRIIKEFGLNGTIEHATEGHLMCDYLKENHQRVIIGPTLGSKTKYELRNKTFESARILHEAGVQFAIMTDHPVIQLANALTQVGLFVREGLPELDAFKAVTIEAAKILGIDDRLGSIAPGKDADLVIWSGHPLHYLTKTEYVIINGEIAHRVGI